MEITVAPAGSNKPSSSLNPLAPVWGRQTFRMLVVGASGSGKSNMVASLVRHYVPWQTLTVCARHLGGDLYEALKEDIEAYEERKGRPVSVWCERLEELPPLDAYSPDNRNLVWIDDFMNEPPKVQQPVVELFTSGRHRNIAVVYVAQSLGRVPADIKRNASVVCVFKGYTADDAEQLWKHHGGTMTKEQWRTYLNEATTTRYGFAVIDEQAPHDRLRYRVGWDEVYIP